MITDELVKEANLRQIAYRDGAEYELCKQSAISSLFSMGNSEEETDKVEIEYFDLPSLSIYEKRQLLVKVYKDRCFCLIGGLAKYKGEEDYTALRRADAYGITILRYQLFTIQP